MEKKHCKNVNFGPILEKVIFLKWKLKTGLNELLKCPKFKKKFKREHTANFCFCPSNVSQNLAGKIRWQEKYLHIVTNSAHNIGANTDEYP